MQKITDVATKSQVESMLGRRLRPWWGTSPWKLILRGLIGAAIFGLVVYGCLQVRAGEVDLAGSGLEDQRATMDRVALVVGILASIGVVYRLVQLVVGALDAIPRQVVEGTVIAAAERRTGDFLPGIVQTLWYRRHDEHGNSRELRRRTRREVVLETADGHRSWNVRPRVFRDVQVGSTVRLTASPLLGHVTSITAVDGSFTPQ